MDYTPIEEELAEEFRKKLIEYYKTFNTDTIIIKQIEGFDKETLIQMAIREAILRFEKRINDKKEEQKQQ